jgi:hypothetical protein
VRIFARPGLNIIVGTRTYVGGPKLEENQKFTARVYSQILQLIINRSIMLVQVEQLVKELV